MVDLKAQYRSVKSEVDSAIREVMESCKFILGDNVRMLEQEVAELCGATYGIGVNSGTDAIIIALAALGIGPGDEVITTPFTFVATTEVIAILGAKPVYADIDPITFNLNSDSIEEKISPYTKAILPVHLYGHPADVSRIQEVARSYGLYVIYDGAQSVGAEAFGHPIGTYGDVVTLSFFPTKNLGAAGDGGMILTNNIDIAERARLLRFHGSGGSYSYKYVGYCSRLDELQAAILRAKLPRLRDWIESRRRNATRYAELLVNTGLVLPSESSWAKHAYHQYTIRCHSRDELRDYLKSNEVDTGVYYPNPLHLETAYSYLGYSIGDFPEAERACREVLSLPICPEISEEQIEFVATTIRSFYGS